MTTLTVGAGMQYATIAQAVAASHDGDVVQVNAGTYVNDFVQINDSITLVSAVGMATILATVPPTNLKGILTIGDSSHAPTVTVQGFVLTGATIAAAAGNNGAGIRYQNGNLTLKDDLITNNQEGMLAFPAIGDTGTIVVDHTEFAANGAGDGQTHNVYVGNVADFRFQDSVSTGARVGHDIKSRAFNTEILNSTISDGPSGTASYEIDLPNGGNALIQGNTIEQGPSSQNPVIIAYGEEGNLHPGTLSVSGNVILNDQTSHAPIGVWNATTLAASVSGNSYYGMIPAQLAQGPATLGGNVALTAEPSLDMTPPYITQPTTISASNTVVATGTTGANLVISGAFSTVLMGAGGGTVVTQGTADVVVTTPGASDRITMQVGGAIASLGNDDITLGSGEVLVSAKGGDTIHAATGLLCLQAEAGSSSTVAGGSGTFIYQGNGGGLSFVGGAGLSLIDAGTGAAQITFGSGVTSLRAGTGPEVLRFVAGQGGGQDFITGFNPALDTLSFQGFAGNPVQVHAASAGSTFWQLSDGTRIVFVGSGSVPLPP